MAKKPARTWGMVLALGPLLAVVVVAAMWASFTALIDVARVNGVVVPALLPIVVDVGMIASNVAAVYFRTLGLKGRGLAYVIFFGFASVSMYANITHAWLASDFTQTSIVTAVVIAAIFPAGQLGVTHMVMLLIPDQKERDRMQRDRELAEQRELAAAAALSAAVPAQPARKPGAQLTRSHEQAQSGAEWSGLATPPAPLQKPVTLPESATDVPVGPLRLVDTVAAEISEGDVREQVLDYIQEEGKRPTGVLVGEWLGKGAKTGQRFLKKLEDEGAFEPRPAFAESAL